MLGHIDRVVEHDEAAMAEHGADRGQRLVIHGGIEEIVRDIGAERATDLNGADRATAQCAAAETFDDLAQRYPEIEFGEAAALDVSGDLDWKGTKRPVEAVGRIGSAAIGQNPRHARERDDIVDDGGFAEEPLQSRDRRLGADDAALALEAFEQGGFLAANIGAGTEADFEVEGVAGAENGCAENSGALGETDCGLQRAEGVRIFGTEIDEALRCPDGDGGDCHTLDQGEGVALHQHAVGEGAAIAFIGVADDVFLVALGVVNGFPFDARREAGTAATTQAGDADFFNCCGTANGNGFLKPFEAAMGPVGIERQRINDTNAGEGEAVLALHPVHLVGEAMAELVRAAGEEICIEQRGDIGHGDGAIGDAARRGFDLDEGFEPEHAAGAVADDLDGSTALCCLAGNVGGYSIGADREGCGVNRNIDPECGAHDKAPLTIS